MLNSLQLLNFNTGFEPVFSEDERRFVLRTCQRTVILAFTDISISNAPEDKAYKMLSGKEAYKYLLEITCGLQSKLIGESEIVSQVKDAYKSYISGGLVDNKILAILEKLFKDTKEIRTKYLIGLGQKTYASIARRKIFNNCQAKQVVIHGSGKLAEDLINQFKKKCEVYVCARNKESVARLTKKHGIKSIDWESQDDTSSFPFHINTIGADTILFQHSFFDSWLAHSKKCFIDLGSPSVVSSLFLEEIISLQDILAEGALKEKEKTHKLNLAKEAMNEIVEKRRQNFIKKSFCELKYV